MVQALVHENLNLHMTSESAINLATLQTRSPGFSQSLAVGIQLLFMMHHLSL